MMHIGVTNRSRKKARDIAAGAKCNRSPMCMNPILLPREIIDYIVDSLRNDRCTLASLRLLNHAWNASASLHLFRTVDLNFPDYPNFLRIAQLKFRGFDRFKPFLSLLESGTETISHCVRQVILDQIRRYATKGELDDDAVLLIPIVSRFTHISDLVFRGIKWSTLPSSFSSCILGICKSPTLERIDFWCCSMPVSSFLDILQASSNLKTLRLLRSGIKDSEPSSSSSSSSENQYCTNVTTPFLSSLVVHRASDRLLHVFKLDKLKELYWDLSHNNILGAEFLKNVGKSLESLVIELAPRLSTPQLDLSHCPRLQHLRISGLPWSLSICPSTYFSSLFARIPDRSFPIERLELVIHPFSPRTIICAYEKTSSESADLRHQCQPQCQHGDGNGVGHHPSKLCYSGWLTVDESLSRSRIFQSLKTLEISVQQFDEGVVELSELSDSFPRLKNKGVQVIWTVFEYTV